MPALELIAGQATAPDTTLTALTMNTGNSATIRNTNGDSDILLLNCWADVQLTGVLRIRSPRLHDNVQGIRLNTVASEPRPLLPFAAPQRLISQDTLTLEISGSATAGDIEQAAFLIYYEQLPGIEARFITAEEYKQRAVAQSAFSNTISTGTAGGYSGEETIVAEFDNLKANTDYALPGYQCSIECCAVRYRGTDTGNLGIGGPGHAEDKDLTANWFVMLSEKFNLPLIPVFNSANKNSILLDVMQDENGADPIISTIFTELAS